MAVGIAAWLKPYALPLVGGLAGLLACLICPSYQLALLLVLFGPLVAMTGWINGRGPGLLTWSMALVTGVLLIWQDPGRLSNPEWIVVLLAFLLETFLLAWVTWRWHQRWRRLMSRSQRAHRWLAAFPHGFWVLDERGQTRHVNRRMAHWLGVSMRSLSGRWLADFFPALPPLHEWPSEQSLELKTPAGFWLQLIAKELPSAPPRARQWLMLATDITPLRREAQAHRFLAEASRVLAFSLDQENTLRRIASLPIPDLADYCIVDLLLNSHTLRRVALAHIDPSKHQLAWDMDRLYPRTMTDLEGSPEVIRSGKSKLYRDLEESVLATLAHDALHLQMLRELGMRSAMVIPLPARGRILGALSLISATPGRYDSADLAVAQDLACRAALAIDNARRYEQILDASLAKEEFLSRIRQEFQPALGNVQKQLGLLRQQDLDAPASLSIWNALELTVSTQRAALEEWLDFASILTREVQLQLQPCDLKPLLDQVVEATRSEARGKGVRLQLNSESHGACIRGDMPRLQQVLRHLLINALNFTPAGGEISLSLSRQETFLTLEIHDTGRGIEPEILPLLLARYLPRQATSEHRQLRMGLSLVQRLVELHGGLIQIESPGTNLGTTIRIKLPILAVRPEWDSLPKPGELLRGVRILVVDDDPEARRLVTRVLEFCGGEASAVGSAEEAIARLSWMNPHVLVSDLSMPGLDGIALMTQIRNQERNRGQEHPVPAIALTAYIHEEDRQRALLAGFQRHLPKPVEPEELVQVISELAMNR